MNGRRDDTERNVYINDTSLICPIGANVREVRDRLLSGNPPPISGSVVLNDDRCVPVGNLNAEFARDRDEQASRCNQIADYCLDKFLPETRDFLAQIAPDRIGVIIGTCTSGVREGEAATRDRLAEGRWPATFQFSQQELGDTASHISARLGATGPTYGVSTACTSGAKALVCGARLIKAGLCDAVVAGGIDSLCGLTLNGFAVLESLSKNVCNPFSINRCGINLGEGGALFALSPRMGQTRLAGWGETADAYHISAPDPQGLGAQHAMEMALTRACLRESDIGYLNLHGTGTKQNDAMEALAVSRVFGLDLPCSSTKPMTGHMLGAAGACETAFVLFALEAGQMPVHLWDGERDEALPPIRLVGGDDQGCSKPYAMTCSYAFGGNNVALVLERE